MSKRKYVCRGCNGVRQPSMYLCRTCWYKLPMSSRMALLIEDDLAVRRLAWMHGQIRVGVPLSEIRVMRNHT